MNPALSTAHSTVFHIKDNPYLPCPAVANKISQHNLHSNMLYRPSTAHALYTVSRICIRQIISAMLSSNYIAAIHNITHSPYTSTRTTHPCRTTHPTAFHNPPICTPLTQGIVGKMAQDVGMVESIVVSFPSSLVGF